MEIEFSVTEAINTGDVMKKIMYDCSIENIVSIQVARKLSGTEIDPDSIVVVQKGCDLSDFIFPEHEYLTVLVFIEDFTGGVIRGIHFGEDDHEPGAPLYPDVLNPDACRKFLSIVYETFYRRFGQYFGNTVKAIFTDEPRPLAKRSPSYFKPWTGGFLQYLLENGFKEEHLPFLWYDGGERTTGIRREYERIVYKKLAEAFYKPLSDWCAAHNIALAGHPMKADDIGFQKYFHIPGQDLVLRWVEPGNANALEGRESTQAKCTSDAARHSGKRRNSNECFGGTGWRYNVDEMKWMMDWLFVRGVNLLLPHAFYYSVRGQRYNERPPDVGPNNLWWPHYRMISNYIKRMCWLMTDSVNQAEVAVICEKDYMSWRIAKPFFLNQIEFNYLEDSMFLSDECRLDGNFLVLRKQRYSIIVIEDSFPIKGAFVKKLEKFIQNGGRVVLYKTDGMARFESDYGIIETGSDEMLVEVIEKIVQPNSKTAAF